MKNFVEWIKSGEIAFLFAFFVKLHPTYFIYAIHWNLSGTVGTLEQFNELHVGKSKTQAQRKIFYWKIISKIGFPRR